MDGSCLFVSHWVFLMLLEGSHLGNFDLTNEADGRSVLWLSLYGITFIVSTCSITLGLEPTPS